MVLEADRMALYGGLRIRRGILHISFNVTVVVSREGGREGGGGPCYGRDVTSASRPAVLHTGRKLEQILSFIVSASDNSN